MTHALSLLGGILLIASIILTKEHHFPGKQALMPVIATVFIIMAGKDGIINKYLLSNKVLVWFGLISYPMYLWHWPLLSMARIVRMEEPTIWYRLLAFPICTLLAWLTTQLIENPLRFGRYGKTKTIMLFLMMVAVGIGSFFIYKNKGEMVRLNIEIVDKEKAKEIETLWNESKLRCNRQFPDWDGLSDNKCAMQKDKNTIAIIGDSHAGHLFSGLAEQTRENEGIGLYTKKRGRFHSKRFNKSLIIF